MKANPAFVSALFFLTLTVCSFQSIAQCNATLSVITRESRCKATGEISLSVTGGSGNYNYKVTNGTFNTITSTNTISGLQAGAYSIEVKDLVSGCIYTQNNVVVAGNYQDPRFQLNVSDVTCINGNNGIITVVNLQYGRGPFTYTMVAPSASQVGTSNTSGVFSNLIPGNYYVRLTDSCGGIQTRTITVANYNWWIDAKTVTKVGCDQATATVDLRDSKGNTNASGATFNGFMYGVARGPGDTSWYSTRTFTFSKGTLRSFNIVVKDLCGNVKGSGWTENNKPQVASSVTISNQSCNNFSATVTGQLNLTSPQYCLYDNSNNLVSCNTTGVFNNVPYGAYCIRVRDNCYDTTIQRCFTVTQPVPAVSANVTISNLACSRFTAAITGQVNLTTPQYCLYDNLNNLIACNGSGTFNNIPYGSYCIRITDGCTGAVINRCFTQLPPVPNVGAAISISNIGCTSFSATVTGQQNLNGAQYCIYNNLGVLIACNSTGVFNGLPFGSYCINVNNDPVCFDTTIVRCFTVTAPVPSVASSVSISNQTCNSFRATITGQQNLNNPQYCLYDNTNTLVSCNTNGQFNNLPYGSYCIRITNDAACYDTVIQRCFTVTRPVPSVASTVQVSNRACSTFTATITGQQNLTNPQYCLYNNLNVLISCNTTGVFNSVPYGAYCIRVVNTCYDTTINRCFSAAPTPMNLVATAATSCTVGATDFNVDWSATTSPYTVDVYNPGGVLVRSTSAGSSYANVLGLPGLPVGLRYSVVVTDACGNKDTVLVTPLASWLNKSVNANSKCPSGQWQNGSGDLTVFCQYSNGTVTPKIIFKGASAVNITHNFSSGGNYTFNNMEPATYIIEYTLNGCSNKVYDTFSLAQYTYPNLAQSAIYQCNNNSFGVNSVVNGGLAPFNYEIIGSLPNTPSIAATAQVSPLFNINNGTAYSLVRLRTIDACGNATINDASILPLANTVVSATSNCFYNDITLNVDTIPNAAYTWYRKTSATDSVQVGTNQSHNIPYLMPGDTGTYVCKVSVNSGCLTRISYFNLNGICGGAALSVNNFNFTGSLQNDKTLLTWTTSKDFAADEFVVERSNDGRNFKALGTVKASSNITSGSRQYLFTDNHPEIGNNQYRIRIVKRNRDLTYSKVIIVSRTDKGAIVVNPNPVTSNYRVQFNGIRTGKYTINLVNSIGALVSSDNCTIASGEVKYMQRPASATAGTYYLVIIDQQTNSRNITKILFQ